MSKHTNSIYITKLWIIFINIACLCASDINKGDVINNSKDLFFCCVIKSNCSNPDLKTPDLPQHKMALHYDFNSLNVPFKYQIIKLIKVPVDEDIDGECSSKDNLDEDEAPVDSSIADLPPTFKPRFFSKIQYYFNNNTQKK